MVCWIVQCENWIAIKKLLYPLNRVRKLKEKKHFVEVKVKACNIYFVLNDANLFHNLYISSKTVPLGQGLNW